MPIKTRVWCTFSIAGFHCWPEAPDNVSYLRSIHRHVFGFKISVSVPHPDRSIEFHTLEAHCIDLIYRLYKEKDEVVENGYSLNFENDSCEMIAIKLLQSLASSSLYRDREIEVTVSEDDENGGTAINTP